VKAAFRLMEGGLLESRARLQIEAKASRHAAAFGKR
jgi:hypothetical protein